MSLPREYLVDTQDYLDSLELNSTRVASHRTMQGVPVSAAVS